MTLPKTTHLHSTCNTFTHKAYKYISLIQKVRIDISYGGELKHLHICYLKEIVM